MTTPLHERLYRTEAVVLHRTAIGEADYILTLYTPHLGKIRVVARGVRKPTSHLGGHVELFTRVRLLLARARNLDIVTQAETIDSQRQLGEDLGRVAHGFYVAELLDRLTPDGQENYAVYHLLAETLGLLNDVAVPELLARWYEVQLLGLLGYRPELIECVECRTVLGPEVSGWSPALGGVLCPACRRVTAARELSVTAFKMLRLMQRSPWLEVARVRVSPTVLEELDRVMSAYVNHVLEREPRSAVFLKIAEQAAGYAAPEDPA